MHHCLCSHEVALQRLLRQLVSLRLVMLKEADPNVTAVQLIDGCKRKEYPNVYYTSPTKYMKWLMCASANGVPRMKCVLGDCEKCGYVLLEGISGTVDYTKAHTWDVFKIVTDDYGQKTYGHTTMTGTRQDFMCLAEESIFAFMHHHHRHMYIADTQFRVRTWTEMGELLGYVDLTADFAHGISLREKFEPQQAFWHQQYATLFVVTGRMYDGETLKMRHVTFLFFSDDHTQDNDFVQWCMEWVLDYLQELPGYGHGPAKLKCVRLWSDRCCEQFMQRRMFGFISRTHNIGKNQTRKDGHPKPIVKFGLNTTCECHGKNEADAQTAIAKNKVCFNLHLLHFTWARVG